MRYFSTYHEFLKEDRENWGWKNMFFSSLFSSEILQGQNILLFTSQGTVEGNYLRSAIETFFIKHILKY